MLTDDGRFVGIRQEDADVDELLEAYVDDNAEPGDESTFDERPHDRSLADLGGRRRRPRLLDDPDRAATRATLGETCWSTARRAATTRSS